MFSRFDVTVVERFPDLSVASLQIDLRGHGIEAMRRMGIESAIRAKCVHETGLELVDTTGRRWACPVSFISLFNSHEWESRRSFLDMEMHGSLSLMQSFNRSLDRVAPRVAQCYASWSSLPFYLPLAVAQHKRVTKSFL
ncbi:hypothetical protein K4F52_003156 [Lecanicillium sp. MT-2017a]|nr:hypothetical protein K4F52_003156 [Lecanicillium sp. MT-2017a]